VTREVWIFVAGSIAIGAALIGALRPVFAARFGQEALPSLAYGVISCALVIGASFFVLRRAMTASNRSFQIAFLGGILGRLLLFAAAVAVAFAVAGLNGRAAAIALAAAFAPLTALEIACVVHERSSASRGGAGRMRHV
jgi:hypothetical protein